MTSSQINLRRELYEDLFSRINFNELLSSVDSYRKYKQECNLQADSVIIENLKSFGLPPTDLIQKIGDKNENRFHFLNNSGRRALATIIGALRKDLPELRFSPLLVSVLALLLHFTDEEEQVYLWGIKLVTEITDKNALKMVDLTKKEFHLSYTTLRTLASKKVKKRIQKNMVIKYNAHVYWSLECLPFHYAICVLDLYLSEGYKVLLRASLLILQLFYNQTRYQSVGN